MITKYAKKVLSAVLFAYENISLIPVKRYDGDVAYASAYGAFGSWPYSMSSITFFSTSNNSSGIKIGSGSAIPTEDDYNLDELITDGVTGSITLNRSTDENGNTITTALVTVTNNGNAEITLTEIGYFVLLKCSSTIESTASNNQAVMIDRTLLSAPIILSTNDTATIEYKLSGICG